MAVSLKSFVSSVTKTIKIEWIRKKMKIFWKKTAQKFVSSENIITFALAFREMHFWKLGIQLVNACHFRRKYAEIAQLVEHNLAKVGVAGPSPVFRSIFWNILFGRCFRTARKRKCPGGGIGRRARFRCVCREACRFESCSGHFSECLFDGEVAELVDALLWGGSVNCDVGVRVSSSSP